MITSQRFQLHLITDGMKRTSEMREFVAKAVRGGTDVIQLRYKSAPALDIYHLSESIFPIIQDYHAKLLINDRVDVALAIAAHGVHLAGKSIPLTSSRRMAPPDWILGCSVHSVEDAKLAEQQGASYITFGHIFHTKSKPGLLPHGVEGLQAVVDAVSIPVLAIGGITADNVDEVLATGCAGIAVLGVALQEKDPEVAIGQLRAKMDASSYQPRPSRALI